ncbi:MAG TPA: L-threonylcarbamoyladenylate synthase [Candidatus Cybelea sp.]|jgi:L-threonylcarbamoyladenylate synthase
MIVPADRSSIRRGAMLLREGGVVAFPTETVYGLGADVFAPQAVARVFEIKGRPAFDPLIVHVTDVAMLERVATGLPEGAAPLIERFWPGPLTLVLPKQSAVPSLVTAGLPTVAVRMPAHPVARQLIEATGSPLAAPSANPFGRVSPTRAEHVDRLLGAHVDLILDGGAAERGIESTIVTLEPYPALLRPGAIATEEIEAVIGPLKRPVDAAVRGPGRIATHYAPATKLRVIEPSAVGPEQRRGAGVLSFRGQFEGYAAARVLSAGGDMREAAAKLFEALHELDALGLERIDAQPVPERGLGMAIMDRLRRAAR